MDQKQYPGGRRTTKSVVGLAASVLAVSLRRESYGILPISDEVIASQQRIADTFLGFGLMPKAVTVSDAQRKPGS